MTSKLTKTLKIGIKKVWQKPLKFPISNILKRGGGWVCGHHTLAGLAQTTHKRWRCLNLTKRPSGKWPSRLLLSFLKIIAKNKEWHQYKVTPYETHKSRLVIGWFLFYNVSWLVSFEFVIDVREDGTTLYGRIYLCTYNRSKAFSSRNASRSIVCIWFSDSCLQEKEIYFL